MLQKLSLFVLLIIIQTGAFALVDTTNIPLYRQYFHDKIDAEQMACDKIDGKVDRLMRIGNNEEVNFRMTDNLYRKIDELQSWVEANDKIEKNNDKVRSLGYIEQELRLFKQAQKKREVPASEFPAIIDNFILMLKAQETGTSLVPFIEDKPYIIARLNAMAFQDHPNFKEMEKLVFFKYCTIHPDIILTSIRPFVKEPFADSLIVIACKYNPAQLYTYAQSINTPEGRLIHQNKNPLVINVAKLSQTENALMYFPFLDDIISGKKKLEELQKIIGDGEAKFDSLGYYRMLVKTETEYFYRMSSPAKDTPIAMFGPNGLREVLRDRAIRHFITPINNLHDETNLNVRMKALDSLSAAEIYYMIVMGEGDIYTSSFKHSFNRMLQRMGAKPRCDSLLLQVKFDFFKKFIKITANFNRLDTFLKKMPPSSSEALMKAFVANLDRSGGLEDATDVADSYSSISNIDLKKRILEYVDENETNSINENNEQGEIIYGLLKNIFLSSDTTKRIDLSKMAGIPSIYELEKNGMQDDSGRIIQQVFFYGDEDGKTYFTPFLNSFSPKEWRITKKKEWVEIKSVKGNVWIFANLPLDYDANLDDSAQVHLIAYLEENELLPTIVIHRGHSYWLPGTISRMPMNAKIVLLGSCGGYKNLQKILEISPDAHIISTKEIGAGDINRPILNALNYALINKDKIIWRDMWSNLTQLFSQDKNKAIKESWESYIPPYKNLGAIFIKAYNKKMETM